MLRIEKIFEYARLEEYKIWVCGFPQHFITISTLDSLILFLWAFCHRMKLEIWMHIIWFITTIINKNVTDHHLCLEVLVHLMINQCIKFFWHIFFEKYRLIVYFDTHSWCFPHLFLPVDASNIFGKISQMRFYSSPVEKQEFS